MSVILLYLQEKSALAWLEGMVDLALDRAVLSGPKVDLPRSLSLMRQALSKKRVSQRCASPQIRFEFPAKNISISSAAPRNGSSSGGPPSPPPSPSPSTCPSSRGPGGRGTRRPSTSTQTHSQGMKTVGSIPMT